MPQSLNVFAPEATIRLAPFIRSRVAMFGVPGAGAAPSVVHSAPNPVYTIL